MSRINKTSEIWREQSFILFKPVCEEINVIFSPLLISGKIMNPSLWKFQIVELCLQSFCFNINETYIWQSNHIHGLRPPSQHCFVTDITYWSIGCSLPIISEVLHWIGNFLPIVHALKIITLLYFRNKVICLLEL